MNQPQLGRVVMVIPTYNESANIEWIIGRLRSAQPHVDVLVMDDNSPDGTGKIVEAIAERDPQVQVVHRTEKAGLGAAYRHGFRVALDRGDAALGDEPDHALGHLGRTLHLDPVDGPERPGQLGHVHPRPAVDVGRVLTSQDVDAHGSNLDRAPGRHHLSPGGQRSTRLVSWQRSAVPV